MYSAMYRLGEELVKALKERRATEPWTRQSTDNWMKPAVRSVALMVVLIVALSAIYVARSQPKIMQHQMQQAEAVQPKQHRTFEEIMDQADDMVLQSMEKSLQADISAGLKSPQLAASEMELERAKLRHERLKREEFFSMRSERTPPPSSPTADAMQP
ncbi:MAG: hypothetical protein NTAFB05_20880 [Nitrobacter sp.]